jgi:hypothetical protein
MIVRETCLRRLAETILLFLSFVDVTHLAAAELPPGLSRFNPAGLSENWLYEGTAFWAFRAPNPSLATVPILRLHHPRNGFLLASSEAEASAAEKRGYVREGTAFYAPANSGVPVLRFRNPKSDSLFYTTSREEGAKANFSYESVAFYSYDPQTGAKSAASTTSDAPNVVSVARYRDGASGIYLFTAGRESPYQVGAYYFGSFTPSAKEIISGTQKVYGRKDDWWGGVEDFYGAERGIGKDHRGWSDEWPDLKPEIGYYDQTSVETLEQHITQAADAGLTFFSFYWYWSNAKHGELFPEALSSFLHAGNVTRLKFNLSLYAHPWSDDMTINAGNTEEVARRLVSYFANPQYLRLPDGRPVFSIGDDRNVRGANGEKCTEAGCNEKALGAFLDVLKKRSIEELGVAPFIEVQAGVPAWDHQTGEDGVTCLVPPVKIAGGTPYPSLSKDTFASLMGPNKPVSPCMLENFDERPRQDILIPDRAAIRYLVGKTDSLFRHNLSVAKEISDQNYQALKSPASRTVYLYAWNEWHEGGILEPNVHTDARDLNIVTDVFQLPRSPSLCLDKGDCKLHPH